MWATFGDAAASSQIKGGIGCMPRPHANAHLFDNHLLLTCLSATFLSDSDLGVSSTHTHTPTHTRTTVSRVMRQLESIFNFNDNSLATCCPSTTRAAAKLMDKKKAQPTTLELGRTYRNTPWYWSCSRCSFCCCCC